MSNLSRQQSLMKKAMSPNEMNRLAPYKLAFTLAKNKLPFSACEAFVSFAKAADPESLVFKHMASSRNTIATKTVELHQKVLQPELEQKISNSPYWSLMVDDCTDSAVKEQCGVYGRFIDIDQEAISSSFLAFHQVVGHPTSENIYQSILKVIGKDGLDLPLNKMVAFTCDGASVMISNQQGVFGKLRREINPKLFLTHCPPHRLVLASKTAQKEIPDFVEKTISDVLFYFKDSPTRRDQFHLLLELTDPEHEFIGTVNYHKVRWLSLSDCVNRVCSLLPSLVRFFEEEKNDTANRIAIRKKAEDLHKRVVEPLFALYIFFLQPNLEILADVNRQLQKANQSLYSTYCKIKAFRATLLEPLLHDPTGNVTDSNLLSIDVAVTKFLGEEFQKHLSQCEEHSLLTERQLSDARKCMYAYLKTVGKAIENRFHELEFITNNFSFIDPKQRKLCHCDIQLVVKKFANDNEMNFNKTTLYKQYRNYTHDTTLDFLFEVQTL